MKFCPECAAPQATQSSASKTSCPRCKSESSNILVCITDGCTKSFCEICHPNSRWGYDPVHDYDETEPHYEEFAFDSGVGEGPFCPQCMVEIKEGKIEIITPEHASRKLKAEISDQILRQKATEELEHIVAEQQERLSAIQAAQPLGFLYGQGLAAQMVRMFRAEGLFQWWAKNQREGFLAICWAINFVAFLIMIAIHPEPDEPAEGIYLILIQFSGFILVFPFFWSLGWVLWKFKFARFWALTQIPWMIAYPANPDFWVPYVMVTWTIPVVYLLWLHNKDWTTEHERSKEELLKNWETKLDNDDRFQKKMERYTTVAVIEEDTFWIGYAIGNPISARKEITSLLGGVEFASWEKLEVWTAEYVALQIERNSFTRGDEDEKYDQIDIAIRNLEKSLSRHSISDVIFPSMLE